MGDRLGTLGAVGFSFTLFISRLFANSRTTLAASKASMAGKPRHPPFATRHPEKEGLLRAASMPFVLQQSLLRIVQGDRALPKQSLADTPFSKWVNRTEQSFRGCSLTSGSLLPLLAVKNCTTYGYQKSNKNPTNPAFKCQRPYHAEHTSSRPITEVKQR